MTKNSLRFSELAYILDQIEEHDSDYEVRYPLVLHALAVAADLGYSCGIARDPVAGHDWPVVYIDLPTGGQVSWHIPAYEREWDGHDNPEKYRRCRAYRWEVNSR